MNQYIANIYGTAGHAKVASQGGVELPETLNDLAFMLAREVNGDDAPMNKVAADSSAILEGLVQFDQSGRLMAQYQFSALEKQASEGDQAAHAALVDFLEMSDGEDEGGDDRLELVRAEIARRKLR